MFFRALPVDHHRAANLRRRRRVAHAPKTGPFSVVSSSADTRGGAVVVPSPAPFHGGANGVGDGHSVGARGSGVRLALPTDRAQPHHAGVPQEQLHLRQQPAVRPRRVEEPLR